MQEVLSAAISLWGVLRMVEVEGAGSPQFGLDCRMYCSAAAGQDCKLHTDFLDSLWGNYAIRAGDVYVA